MANLRRIAQGKECQIRIPGVCNHNEETTVLCHDSGAGLALKWNDLLAAWGCYDCHMEVDGHTRRISDRQLVRIYFLEGVLRTQSELLAMGIIHA